MLNVTNVMVRAVLCVCVCMRSQTTGDDSWTAVWERIGVVCNLEPVVKWRAVIKL